MVKGGVGALTLAVAAFLFVRGRIDFALAIGGVGLWLLGLGAAPQWMDQFRTAGTPRPSVSKVRSALLQMELDHDTGMLDGDILGGPWEGRRLSSLEGGDLGVQLLLGRRQQGQHRGEIGVACVQLRPTCRQRLHDAQLSRRDSCLLGQLLRRQRTDRRRGSRGRGRRTSRHSLLGPGLRTLEETGRNADGAHQHDPAYGNGDQGKQAGDFAHVRLLERALWSQGARHRTPGTTMDSGGEEIFVQITARLV
jgi:hypothetical protein